MISQNQIQRMIDAGAFGRLVGRILANGRCRSGEAARRLQSPEAALPAGLGLALQRLCELTYGPNPLADALAIRLLNLQRPNGLFGVTAQPSAAASAVALRGLLAWIEQTEGGAEIDQSRVLEALSRGVRGVAATVEAFPLRGFADAVDVEVVLWQLAGSTLFRQTIAEGAIPRLTAALPRPDVRDDLTRFALAAAA